MSSQIVPISSDEGNTRPRQISPCNGWCFTLNNYSDYEYSSLVLLFRSSQFNEKYLYIVGKEVGEGGTPHLQGYFCLRNPKSKFRPMKILDNKRIHFERAKGDRKQNFVYCSKDGNYIHNMNEYVPYTLELENKSQWMRDLEEKIKTYEEDRLIYWFWSNGGNLGKTSFQKYIYTHYDGVLPLSGKGGDMKNGVLSYIEKFSKTPKIILVNLPRSLSKDYVSYGSIEVIKDMFFYSGKYEGGVVCGKQPMIIFFANEEPNKEVFSDDRWRVTHIDKQPNIFDEDEA